MYICLIICLSILPAWLFPSFLASLPCQRYCFPSHRWLVHHEPPSSSFLSDAPVVVSHPSPRVKTCSLAFLLRLPPLSSLCLSLPALFLVLPFFSYPPLCPYSCLILLVSLSFLVCLSSYTPVFLGVLRSLLSALSHLSAMLSCFRLPPSLSSYTASLPPFQPTYLLAFLSYTLLFIFPLPFLSPYLP